MNGLKNNFPDGEDGGDRRVRSAAPGARQGAARRRVHGLVRRVGGESREFSILQGSLL